MDDFDTMFRATAQACVQSYEAGLKTGAEDAQESTEAELSPLALFFLEAVQRAAERKARPLYVRMGLHNEQCAPLARSLKGSLIGLIEVCFAGAEDEVSWHELEALAVQLGIPADRIQAIREGTP